MAHNGERQTVESYYRELFTKQVLEKLLKPETQDYDIEDSWREKWEKEQAEKRKIELEKLTKKHPMNTSPRTVYHDLYGKNKIHPFRKNTSFSKPLNEQLD